MSADLGILAQAIGGGMKAGTDVLRESDKNQLSFAWGNIQARKERDANLERLKISNENAMAQNSQRSALGVSSAAETRRLVEKEGVDSELAKLKAELDNGLRSGDSYESDKKLIMSGRTLASLGDKTVTMSINQLQALEKLAIEAFPDNPELRQPFIAQKKAEWEGKRRGSSSTVIKNKSDKVQAKLEEGTKRFKKVEGVSDEDKVMSLFTNKETPAAIDALKRRMMREYVGNKKTLKMIEMVANAAKQRLIPPRGPQTEEERYDAYDPSAMDIFNPLKKLQGSVLGRGDYEDYVD